MVPRRLIWAVVALLLGSILGAQELYFEEPRSFASTYRLFPRVDAGERLMAVAYQEIISQDEDSGTFRVAVQTTDDGLSWTPTAPMGLTFPFEGTQIPPVYDLLVSQADNTILVAIVDRDGTTRVQRLDEGGGEWMGVTLSEGETDPRVLDELITTSAPRIFHRSDNGYIMFVTRFVEPNIRLLYSTSDDGVEWSPLLLLPADLRVGSLSNPTVATHEGNDYLVVEGFNPFADDESPIPTTYQLYSAVSTDGGRTWPTIGADHRITDGDFPQGEPDNHRLPDLEIIGGTPTLFWGSGQINRAELAQDGTLADTPRVMTDMAAQLGRLDAIEHPSGTLLIAELNPRLQPSIALFRESGRWYRPETISTGGASSFADAAVFAGRLHTFWQRRETNSLADPARIVYMEPDQRAQPPALAAVNFDPDRRSRLDDAVFSWTPPTDASGIAGYSVIWSRDPDAEVPLEREYGASTRRISVAADSDGRWYLRIRVVDNAGNWSEPTSLSFFRDTTPPGLVRFVPPQVDEDGYLASNTFTLEWAEPGDDIIAGYSYQFSYVGSETEAVAMTVADSVVPPRRVTTTETSISRTNTDDGLWALAVRAIDSVGNIGEAATLLVRLNKYVPSTQIWTIATDQDPLERYNVEIIGRGFTANGVVRTLIVDRDRREPYDYVYTMGEDNFQVDGNGNIIGPILDNLATGVYYLGVVHPERGVFFSPQVLRFERNGTIKYGDFTIRYVPDYEYDPAAFGSLSSVSALVWAVLALLLAIAVFSGTRVVGIAREGRYLTLEARALIAGGPLPALTHRERMQEMKRRGMGLRVKFTLFVVMLVVAVVGMLAVGLGTVTLTNQREILAQGLKDRVDVLMGSISSGARPLLQDAGNNALSIDELPGQIMQMAEARYATISGESFLALSPDSLSEEEIASLQAPRDTTATEYDYVWGTNDPRLEDAGRDVADDPVGGLPRTPVPENTQLSLGVTQVEDSVSDLIPALAEEVNRRVSEALGELPQQIVQAREIEAAVSQRFLFEGTASQEEWDQALDNLGTLTQRASERLDEVTSEVQSYPEFSVEAFDRDQREYIFYKPIAYLGSSGEATDGRFFRGVVRMGVSTDLIVERIDAAREAIIRITIIIAAAAIGAGILGALLLATIVVTPIRKLVRGVEKIRDTEDKEDLKGETIDVRTRDELSVLADTINSMARGLSEAAGASKMLTMGKGTQKMFVPLDKNIETNEKWTTASEDGQYAEFFGYYEGAKGVSGDYFAYQKLDDEHYAVIKSDAAGKGVPAALIMVQVATLFISYFRSWTAKKSGFDITGLVATINDLVSEREFVGLFATLMILIVNTRTGKVYVSHAGDNLMYWLNHGKGTLETFEMDRLPPAGSFAGISYKQYSLSISSGDTLVLFTDGLEEAQRVFRAADYSQMQVAEVQARLTEEGFTEEQIDNAIAKGKNEGDEEVTEEFTVDRRIKPLVEAVKRGGTFELKRLLNPKPEEELVFDFGGIEPTAQNIVFALISVEKVFRIYLDPKATAEDRVQVDKKIEAFLKEHFRQYNRYFPEERRLPEDPRSAYVWYTHMKEDDQYDDLTVLAIRKK